MLRRGEVNGVKESTGAPVSSVSACGAWMTCERLRQKLMNSLPTKSVQRRAEYVVVLE